MNPGTRTVACTACRVDFLDCLCGNITRPIPVIEGETDWTREIPIYEGLPPVARTRYVKRSLLTRATRYIKTNGTALASSLAVVVVAAHVIVTALTGGLR